MVEDISIHYTRTEDGVNIAYTVEHNGPGTPVMLAMNQSQNLERPTVAGSALFAGRTSIRFDPRCKGLSDRHVEDVSLTARELDFGAVQRAVGVGSVAIHAKDQEVWPAVSYAAQRPDSVSHLLLINATTSGAEYWNGTYLRPLKDLADLNFEAFTEAFMWLENGRSEFSKEEVARRAANYRSHIDQHDFTRLQVQDLEIDIEGELQRLSCSVMVSTSSDQTLTGFREVGRRFAAGVPNARLISAPIMERYAVMARFLDEELTEPVPESLVAPAAAGLRSILFTDIEGHTEMMVRLGDERGRVVLRAHERITRDALKEHGGTEVKAMGDGFMSWFPSATAALRCASSLQKAFEDHSEGGEPIRIRAGINAGEPMEEDDDLFGTSVIVAARTAASAAGGQIVVTDVVRQLVAGKEFLFADRGLSNFKGFEDPVRTWEVLW